MKKIITAVALTAALTLGAAPAFAAPAVGADTKVTAGEAGTGVTTVKVETTVSQINATIPITATFALPILGSDFIKTTTGVVPKTYAMKNHSTFALKVTNAKAAAETNWILAAASTGLKDKDATAGKTGDIFLTLTPAVTGQGDAWTAVADPGSNPAWTIPAAKKTSSDPADEGTLLLDITGSHSNLSKAIATATPEAAVVLTYTVAAA
ncbi:MAG: hypothetical protein RR204_00800 [Raoultibacter sp.]